MINTFKLPLTIHYGSDQDIAIVTVLNELVGKWCLGLCLLREGLIEYVSVKGHDGSAQIKIGQDTSIKEHEVGIVHRKGNIIQLMISQIELERWLHFFLKFYRDNQADVDHIDVDIAHDTSAGSKGLFLVLKVPVAAPPVSEQEARLRLGLA